MTAADPGPGSDVDYAVDPDTEPRVLTPWAGFAAILLAAQTAATAYLLTLSPGSIPTSLPGSIVAVAVFAAAAVGVDAWQTRRDWSPTPLLWALPVLVPGLGAGVVLAYLGRRLQSVRPETGSLWVWPAVGASLVSGVATAVLAAAEATALPLAPAAAVLHVANYVFVGLATPAAYFDTRAVDRRLAGTGRGWPLRGYHWVVALSLPVPFRAPLAVLYLLRRWQLLRDVGPAAAPGLDDKT